MRRHPQTTRDETHFCRLRPASVTEFFTSLVDTRDETRTRIALSCWRILSPLCLPIPPPGQILSARSLRAVRAIPRSFEGDLSNLMRSCRSRYATRSQCVGRAADCPDPHRPSLRNRDASRAAKGREFRSSRKSCCMHATLSVALAPCIKRDVTVSANITSTYITVVLACPMQSR
jgi:hypothetical protein